MKHELNSNWIILFLFLATLGCGKEDQLASTGHVEALVVSDRPELSKAVRTKDFSIYSNIEISVSRHSTDDSKDNTLEEKGKEEEVPYVSEKNTILAIRGEGIGWSELYGNVHTELEMAYSRKGHVSKGTVRIGTEDDLGLLFHLGGKQSLIEIQEFDGPHQAIVMDAEFELQTGAFTKAKAVAKAYLLDAGKLHDPDVGSFSTTLIIEGYFEF